MKDSIKRFAGRAAAVVSALSFAISSLAFPASADTYYTRLSWSTFSSLIGSTVQGYYLSDSGVLKPIMLSLHDNNTQYITSVSMDNTLAPNATTLAPNSYICWYKCTIPNDLYLNSESYLPYFQIDWNVHFTNVTYFGCDTICYNQLVYTTLNRQYLANYNTFIAGSNSSSVHTVPFSSGSDTLAGRTYVINKSENFGDYFGGVWAFYEGSATDYYIGSATYSNVAYNRWGDYIYFGISCPVINPEWSFVDNSAPPSSGGGGDGGGSGSGSGSASGSYGDGELNLDLVLPDYSSQLDAIANPSLSAEQEGALSGLDSAGEALGASVDDYDDIVDDIDSYQWEIDGDSFALDTIDGDLPDLTPPTDVVDGVNDLWELLELDRSAPIIVRYMPILILFMFGSYVIFGKWI